MKFMGYKRPDGKVGIRNHVVVMPGVACSDVAARRIAEAVKGTTYLYNSFGCAQSLQDVERTLSILTGMLANPNVHSALIVGLGCESLQGDAYLDRLAKLVPHKTIRYITIHGEGGLYKTVAKGAALASELICEAGACVRKECALSDLMLGLECGGSDPTSGISANVALGEVSDRIVDSGGTTVISETAEAIGAEHVMRARGATPEIGQAIFDAIKEKDRYYRDVVSQDIRKSNPSPGNIRSGLSTLEEKSLGCINKSGTRPFTGCFAYGDIVDVKGAVFLETGTYDATSTIGEIAAGCQTVVFTTGMGNPIGCAVAPVIKITGNHQTYEALTDILDFDTSANLRGEKTVPEVADDLLALILDVCNGKPTKAELNGADVMVIDQYFMGP
ncbi:UxaA family hydrolase [Oscillospiraceae bacterium OttesenSCG-928-G22]|nr:UxaA family hydrolase [Oscillospiraceae bacterium OttesenSCG-928-G22]